MKNKFLILTTIFLLGFLSMNFTNTDPTAVEVVQKAIDKQQGESNYQEMKMTIVRPTWKRSMTMKGWSKGDDYSLILVTGPARDKGTAFLKRGNEMWNWQPSIDRSIKMPPSMMTQSWMGSDFTNDDLVKQSSVVDDYQHEMLGSEEIEGYDCWKIAMIPNEETAVVWGKVVMWISKKEYMQLKTEFYDEDDYLVNTMLGKEVKEMDGVLLPSRLEVVPAEDEGHMTIIEQLEMKFDEPIKESFFSVQNMKRVR